MNSADFSPCITSRARIPPLCARNLYNKFEGRHVFVEKNLKEKQLFKNQIAVFPNYYSFNMSPTRNIDNYPDIVYTTHFRNQKKYPAPSHVSQPMNTR